METNPSPGSQETFFYKGRPWFLAGVAGGPRRWIDVSTERKFLPLPGSPWMLLCLDLRIQARPHILSPSHVCWTIAPGRVPCPPPFPSTSWCQERAPLLREFSCFVGGRSNAKSTGYEVCCYPPMEKSIRTPNTLPKKHKVYYISSIMKLAVLPIYCLKNTEKVERRRNGQSHTPTSQVQPRLTPDIRVSSQCFSTSVSTFLYPKGSLHPL